MPLDCPPQTPLRVPIHFRVRMGCCRDYCYEPRSVLCMKFKWISGVRVPCRVLREGKRHAPRKEKGHLCILHAHPHLVLPNKLFIHEKLFLIISRAQRGTQENGRSSALSVSRICLSAPQYTYVTIVLHRQPCQYETEVEPIRGTETNTDPTAQHSSSSNTYASWIEGGSGSAGCQRPRAI